MKNKLSLLVCAIICSMMAWADCTPTLHEGDYVLRKNGSLDLTTYKSCDRDNQYQVLGLALVKGDVLTVKNVVYGLEEGGASANFTADKNNGIICQVAGTYDVYIKSDSYKLYIAAVEAVVPEPEVEYSVVGEAPIVPVGGWNVEADENVMTLVDGVYTLTVKDVELKAQGYQYKFISHRDWQHFKLPENGNVTMTVEKAGKYDIVYTLDPVKPEGKHELKLIEEQQDTTTVIPEPEKVVVRFAADWEKVYAYSWAGTAFGTWPGTELQKGEDGWYAVEVEKGTNMLFTASDKGPQTVDILDVQATVCYELGEKANNKYAVVVNEKCELAQDTVPQDTTIVIPEPEKVAVRFVADWEKVYAYSWAGTAFGEWPGTELQKGEDGWYAVEVEKGTNMLFTASDKGPQTVDILDVQAAVCYELGEKKDNKYAVVVNEKCELAQDTVPQDTTIVIPEPEVEYSVVGEAPIVPVGGWNVEADENVMTLVDGVYTLTVKGVELKAQGYQYKFISHRDWQHFQLPENGNITMTVEKAGKYDIVYTLDPVKPEGKHELILLDEDTTIVIPEPEKVAVRFAADWEKVYVYSWGGTAFGAWPGTELQKGEDGWYAVEVEKGTNMLFTASDKGPQTVDILDVQEAVCYELGDEKDNKYEVVVNELCQLQTALDEVEVSAVVRLVDNKLHATIDGTAELVIYNVTGQMIDNQIVTGEYTRALQSGMYLVRIGGQSYKAVVR